MDVGSILKDIWYGMLNVCWNIGECTPGASYIREIVKENDVLLALCAGMATKLMPILIYVHFMLIFDVKKENKLYAKTYKKGKFTKEFPREYYEKKIKETGRYLRSPKRLISTAVILLIEILFIYMIL